MDFMLNFEPKKLSKLISYRDKLLLIGSCFTEHIGSALKDVKFKVLQNPNGILFDPVSVCRSLISYVNNEKYSEEGFFQLNDVWNSWQHHSRFSHVDPKEGLRIINESQETAHQFVKNADWLIITLGTAFSYRLTSNAPGKLNDGVANCHRAPAQWFLKHMLSIQEILESLDACMHQLFQLNPRLEIIFTVSPVRHIRDGVIDNNRSKARLIESVHHIVNKFDKLHYFPAYEIVIDVLRDYRFYDIDLVHPNYMATDFVLQKFISACMDDEAKDLIDEIRKISLARRHKAFQPSTAAHKQFLQSSAEKTKELQRKYPFLDLEEEIAYFDSEVS